MQAKSCKKNVGTQRRNRPRESELRWGYMWSTFAQITPMNSSENQYFRDAGRWTSNQTLGESRTRRRPPPARGVELHREGEEIGAKSRKGIKSREPRHSLNNQVKQSKVQAYKENKGENKGHKRRDGENEQPRPHAGATGQWAQDKACHHFGNNNGHRVGNPSIRRCPK